MINCYHIWKQDLREKGCECVYTFFSWFYKGWDICKRYFYLLYIYDKEANFIFLVKCPVGAIVMMSEHSKSYCHHKLKLLAWKDNCILIDSHKMPNLLAYSRSSVWGSVPWMLCCCLLTYHWVSLWAEKPVQDPRPRELPEMRGGNEMNDDTLNSLGFRCFSSHFWH